ncbi:MAG: hypothetical protein ACYSU0_00350 [Planctomycetota bacterium]|jgi:hypothetical protein
MSSRSTNGRIAQSIIATLLYLVCPLGCATSPSDIEAHHGRRVGSILIDLPSFKTDTEADSWLKETSVTYAALARGIESDRNYRGYRFATRDDIRRGMVARVDGYLEIQLNAGLSGPDRLTTLIFEMANASRFPDHQQVDLAVDRGLITTPEQFGLANEMIEYEALKQHRQVLIEIASRVGELPAGFYYFVTPAPRSIEDYRLPGLYNYLKAQKESGHTAHYYRWFHRRKPGRGTPGKSPERGSTR